jgi:hypothetical protein
MKKLAALLVIPGALFGQVPVDGLLPDSGGSGVPTVQTLAPVAGGAVAAMLAVPEKYADSLLEISGSGGAPNPKEWVLLAWNAENPGSLRKLVVSGDQLVSDSASLSLYEAERKEVAIAMSSLGIDSGGVWNIAQAYASANHMTLGTLDYQLTAHARDVPPLWTVVCRDPSGKPLGKLVILASTGAVQKSSGFQNAP